MFYIFASPVNIPACFVKFFHFFRNILFHFSYPKTFPLTIAKNHKT